MDERKHKRPGLGTGPPQRFSMSRRSFVKLAAATTAAATLTTGTTVALAEDDSASSTGMGEVKRVRSCCRACGKMECGVWLTVQDGKVIKSESDESCFGSAGNHCAKGQASLQSAYHPARLMYPMKRNGPKGEDPQWERISWDEAYTLATEGLHSIVEKYGGETLFTMSGTSRIWAMAGYFSLTAMYGTPNAAVAAQICKGPRYAAASLNYANQQMFWMELVGRPRVYVQWGSAAELSNYDDAGRTVVDVATRADTHISVDPRQANMGREADIWVNLEPGTDGAVANSWAQVIIESELYDDMYVRKWTNAPYLVVEEDSFEPTECDSFSNQIHRKTRLLKESDILEGGSNTRFMVINEMNDNLTWYDARARSDRYPDANPGWEGEDWKPATEGKAPHQAGLNLTGQSQGFLLDYVPFPEGLFPALFTEPGGREITLADGTKVHVRTVWENYIDFLEEYTPEKVSELSGVNPETLRKAAITYATRVDPSSGYGNGAIQYCLAPEHGCNAPQNQRACDLLNALTGNIDTPGGARGGTTAPFGEMVGNPPAAPGPVANPNDPMYADWPKADNSKIIGPERFPMIGGSGVGGLTSDTTSIYDAINTGKPYALHGGVGHAGDFMNQSNNNYAWEQLCKLDFWLSIDVWHTPQVDGIADIVMPVSHWFEMSAPRRGQGSSGAIGATVKVIDPPAECVSDYEVLINLCKYAGLPYQLGETDAEKWPLDDPYAAACINAIGDFPPVADVPRADKWKAYNEAFQKNGWWDSKLVYPDNWGTYRRFQTGVMHARGARQGWATATGKHEIWSTVLEAWMPNQGEEFPRWVPPPHGPISDPDRFKADNAFLLTTGRRQGTYFHSEHRQIPFCREIAPAPRCEINPVDAERLGIQQGDWVWIETDFNGDVYKIRQVADLYYGISPGVANCEHQWWYPELEQPDRGFKLSGVNCITDPWAQDRIMGSSNLRAYAVKIYKATPENSPFGNPVPCGDDGTEIIHDASDPRLKEWAPVYEGRV